MRAFSITAALLLAGLAVTQAVFHVTNVTDDQIESYERLHLFRVNSVAAVDDLKAVFDGVDLRYSFKMIGELEYIFVTAGLTTDVTFPAMTEVIQVPAVHLENFFADVGGTYDAANAPTFDIGTVVTLFEQTLELPPEMSYDDSIELQLRYANIMEPLVKDTNPAMFSTLDNFPERFFIAAPVESDAFSERLTENLIEIFDGPWALVLNSRQAIVI